MRTLITCFIFLICLCAASQEQRMIDSLRKAIVHAKEDTNLVKNLNLLARLIKRNDSKEAMQLAQKALALATTLDNKSALANTYNLLGTVHDDQGHNDSAIAWYKRSLELFSGIGNIAGMGRCYNNIGLTYLNAGRYSISLENLLKGLELREKIGDMKGIAGSYNNIGLLFNEQKNYKKALEYYLKSLPIKEKLDDKLGMANVLINIGLCYGYQGDLKKEYNYYVKALKIQEELGDKVGTSMVYNNIGENLYTQKKYDEAIVYLQKALSLREGLEDERGISQACTNLSKVYIAGKKYNEARPYLEKALSLAIKSHGLRELKLAYHELSDMYSGKGDMAKALEAQKLYSIYSDSLLSEENERQIAEMQTRYETNKKEQQNQLLLQENQAKEAAIQKSHLQNYILIASLLVACVLLYFLFYTNRLKNRLRESETRQKLQNERERISRDLHDNVGSQLSYIMSGIELEVKKAGHNPRLENIGQAAGNTITTLRETIWALHHDTITLTDLTDRLKSFISKQTEFYPDILPEINIKADDIVFTHSEAINLYRITQEAISNLLKYSDAKVFRLIITAEQGSRIKFVVEDNGKGFDTKEIKPEAYGLKNMKYRAQEINAQLEIFSKPGEGTRVTVIV